METLKEKLKDFERKINENTREDKLQEFFEELAPAFLYGGYIQVRNDYRVYIKTIEFYFHSETNGIKDPIVYHRNNNCIECVEVEEEIPYFPLMSLHAHPSGYDITFESTSNHYRASVLIRAYEVKSVDKNNKDDKDVYLIWDTKKEMFVKQEKYCFNTQSTYLYALLNGFNIISSEDYKDKVIWEDDIKDKRFEKDDIKLNIRKNVPLFRPEGNDYVKITKDFYINNKEYVEKLHPVLKKVKPNFFVSGKETCLRDPKLWQFNRVTEI